MIFAAFDTVMFIIVAATTNHTIRCMSNHPLLLPSPLPTSLTSP